MYRVTRTTLRGPFANDRCFLDWLAGFPTASARIVSWSDDPMNDGGPNDRRFYVWFHDVDMPPLKCANGSPDLINSGGKNGWPTEAEALAVVKHQTGKAAEIKQQVDAANEAAVSVENIAKGVAKDVAEGAADVVTGKSLGTVGKLAAGAGVAVAAFWVLSKILGGK